MSRVGHGSIFRDQIQSISSTYTYNPTQSSLDVHNLSNPIHNLVLNRTLELGLCASITSLMLTFNRCKIGIVKSS